MKLNAHWRFGLYGLLLGFCLSRMGYSDFSEIYAMFTFGDPRLYLTFAGGVALITLCFALLLRGKVANRPLHRGTVIGAALFGLGWALTGACPAIALVQIGEGKLAALLSLFGVLLGTAIYPAVHRRFFKWEMGSCNM